MILDYSFFGFNEDTVPLAPPKAMQFGQTLKRLLERIHRTNNQFGSVYMSKIDLSDGFYQLWLWLEDTLKLAVLFLSRPGEDPLVRTHRHPANYVSAHPVYSVDCTFQKNPTVLGYLRGRFLQTCPRKPVDLPLG